MSTQNLTIPDADAQANDLTIERLDVFGEYGGFVTRAVAFIVDIVIVIAMISIMGAVANLLEDFLHLGGPTATLLSFGVAVSGLLLWQGYYILFWMLLGQTPGKYLMGLRIVKVDGSRVTIGAAIRRLIGYYISAILLLGYIWVLFDDRRQGFHDKFAGTFVIYAWSYDKNLERGLPIQMRARKRRRKIATPNLRAG